jgi:putative peptidoglycan lipid II flippase
VKQHELFKASGVMAVGTIISRITGFIGGVIIIATLGTTLLGDAFNVANTMPNILYNLLVGGALTAIFVPQLVRAFDDADGGHLFASRLVTTISAILLVLVVVGVIFAPQLVYMYAPSFSTPGFETEREIAIAFTRYCLPQIFFLGLFTMLGQVANARGSFAPLMWAPIANNLVIITVFSLFLLKWPHINIDSITSAQIQILGLGTTAGIILQALILIPVVRRSGIRIRPKLGVAGLGKSFSLAGWTLVYVLISQIGYLITVNVATTAAVQSAKAGISTGVGFTPFKNAYLIMLLPYSVVTISIVTALLPHLSKLAIDKKFEDVKGQLLRAIKSVGVLTIPSSVAFLLFGPLITKTLFFSIDKNDSIYIGYVLSALSLGLVAFSINLVLVRGFNAFEDTRTQVRSILIINIISVALSYFFLAVLPSEWVTVGLGVAFSVSYLIGLFVTLYLLKKHTGPIYVREFIGQHGRLLCAALMAMLPLFAITQLFGWVGSDSSVAIQIGQLLFVIFAGAVGYYFAAKALRITEVSGITALILRRNKDAE